MILNLARFLDVIPKAGVTEKNQVEFYQINNVLQRLPSRK